MSAISATIDKYVNGDITFDALVEFLATFDWPEIVEEASTNPFDDMLSDSGDYPVDGTFDEVTLARDLRKLTDEEFFVLLDAHNASG
jgi:hypothetical protein